MIDVPSFIVVNFHASADLEAPDASSRACRHAGRRWCRAHEGGEEREQDDQAGAVAASRHQGTPGG